MVITFQRGWIISQIMKYYVNQPTIFLHNHVYNSVLLNVLKVLMPPRASHDLEQLGTEEA